MPAASLVALPLHPALVHFPVALLSLAWAYGIASHVAGRPRWAELALTFETIGLLFVPFTIAAGLLDAGGLDFLLQPDWGSPLIWHFLCSTGAAVVFATHAAWRWRGRRVGVAFSRAPGAILADVRVDLALTTTGFWLLVMTGLLAGEMVFG